MYRLTLNKFNELTLTAYQDMGGCVNRDADSKTISANRSISSLYRSRAVFLDYAKNNEFNYFVTITIDSKKRDIQEQENIKKYILNYFKNFKNRIDADFKYMLVAELGSKNGRLHFHGLIYTNRSKELLKHIRGNKYRNEYIFNNIGANQFIPIDNYNISCANYCVKYFTKDNLSFQIFKHSYYCSKGLARSLDITNNYDYDLLDIVFKFLENQYLAKKLEFCSTFKCDSERFFQILNFVLANRENLDYINNASNINVIASFV